MDNPVEIIQQVVGIKPRIGMLFDYENEAYDFYNRYGRATGFSIRRDSCHKRKDDPTVIVYRRFVCNKQGIKRADKRDKNVAKPRAETRTDCLARMTIIMMASGQYEVREFIEKHNHELHTVETGHLMRSQRHISDVHGFEIDLVSDSGIKPKQAFDYMGLQVGGSENLGYTREDLKNYLRTKRQHSLEYGDAGSLLMYFEEQSRANPSFTYSLQLDSQEQITNIFWADPRMIADYAVFGDVVTFDTTFCTNKQYRPFGLFVGFNHHRAFTIFGAALLYDETVASFKWLFEMFVQSHGGKKPVTIFTDQDAAMGRAIYEVLPNTWHGLCTWHIMQNGMKHLGNLMKEGSSFLSDLKKCIYEYEDESEFEEAWKCLRDDYPVENSSWLDRIYSLKAKWARCYMKHTFTIGMRSTQLSESINGDLKNYLSCKLDLIRFFKHFERVVQDKRANELKADFDARDKLPKNMGSKSPILRHAAKVYTPYIFEKFLKEHNWRDACFLESRIETEDLCEHVVKIVDEEEEVEDREYKVLYKPSMQLIECSCKKFETYGILCQHALKICEFYNIKYIPERYILRRWTRAANSTTVEDSKGKQVVTDIRQDCTERYRFIGPMYVRIATKASNSPEGVDLAHKTGQWLEKQLDELCINCPSTQASAHHVEVNMALAIKKKEGTKGGKRHKSWVEKQGKQKKTGKTRIENNARSMQPMSETPPQPTPSQETCMWDANSHHVANNPTFMSLLPRIPSSQASLASQTSSASPYPFEESGSFYGN